MRIFLSRPTWIPPEFQPGVDTFMNQLGNLGLDPRTLGVSDYPSMAPLDEVIEILATCSGAIVLGVPQLEVTTGKLKGSNLKAPLVLGTEWNHLEAALAYAAGIPLLVISHSTVTRGIFDRGVMNAFLHTVDLSSSNWSMQTALNGAIQQWRDKCKNGSGNHASRRKIAAESGQPTCPNCSVGHKQILMNPVPPPFNGLAGGDWECKQCGYVKPLGSA